MLYAFETEKFGRILVDANDRAEAVKMRKRFPAAGKLEAVRTYRLCLLCDSKPCTCARA